MLIAICLSQIDVIFDLAGAICCSFMLMIFPGVGYVVAHGRYGQFSENSVMYLVAAWSFIVFGCITISLSIYINVLRIMGKLPDPSLEAGVAI